MTQPNQNRLEAVARALAECDGITICEGATYALSSYGPRARAALAADATATGDVVAKMAEALEPFVSGYSHTSVFLRSREKMHPAGQDLYEEDVERARQALTAYHTTMKGEAA